MLFLFEKEAELKWGLKNGIPEMYLTGLIQESLPWFNV